MNCPKCSKKLIDKKDKCAWCEKRICVECCASERFSCSEYCEIKTKQLDDLFDEYWKASQNHDAMNSMRRKEAKSMRKQNLFVELAEYTTRRDVRVGNKNR